MVAKAMPIIVAPQDLGNERFIVQEGQLKYFGAKKAVITIGAYDREYQLVQIVFGKKDGSIYVSTPYLGARDGIVSDVRLASGAKPPYTMSLMDHGRVTSHLVKFAHHPDGSAHFSQTGKVRTDIKRTSFPLSSIGHVFQSHIYWPIGYDALDPAAREKDRVYLRTKVQGPTPAAVLVHAEWRRKRDVIANIHPPGGTSGPITKVQSRRTGDEYTVFFLGQPSGFPLRDHVLMVSCVETTGLANIEDPALIAIAGWDPHEVPSVGMETEHTGVLVAMYPITNADELRAKIGTIDLVPPESTE